MSRTTVIAIDGPAAAGKGTLARRLAIAFELPYLDTGLLYRAVTRRLLDAGTPASETAAAITIAGSLTARDLARGDLRTPDVDRAAAAVASLPDVRDALLKFQRDFVLTRGGVLDGRDIGTVIFPDADAKLFVVASVAARARRRWLELQSRGVTADLPTVMRDLVARDEADVARTAAPLRPAADAVIIDTTELTTDAVFERALELIKALLQVVRP